MVEKTNGTKVNKTKVEALIKSGSFDFLTTNRNQLLHNYFKARGDSYLHIPEKTTKADILTFERDTFGVAISIRSRWEKIEEGANTQITGIVNNIEKWKASSGKEHFNLDIETSEEIVKVTVWGYLYERHSETLMLGNKVTIKGEKSRDKLTAKSATLVNSAYQTA